MDRDNVLSNQKMKRIIICDKDDGEKDKYKKPDTKSSVQKQGR